MFASGENPQQFEDYMHSLLADIYGNNTRDYILETANRLYVQNELTLKDSFVDIIQKHYAGQMLPANFRQDRDAIAQVTLHLAILDWPNDVYELI